VAIYHPQLSYCISQYVEKDPETIVIIVNGLVRYWPWTNAAKQVRTPCHVGLRPNFRMSVPRQRTFVSCLHCQAIIYVRFVPCLICRCCS
jgi:hypothetical protein